MKRRARVPGTVTSSPADLAKVSEGSYLIAAGYVGDHRDLVWGSMIYVCTDKPTPARPVPPGWDRIVADAPPGYWDERDGVPEIVKHGEEKWFPPKPGGCGHWERYYLGLGVEGPEDLRDLKAFIPCPFSAGRCPQCGLSMTHDRWNEDETFTEPYGPAPEGTRYFRVPADKLARKWASEGYGGAELVNPLVAAGAPAS